MKACGHLGLWLTAASMLVLAGCKSTDTAGAGSPSEGSSGGSAPKKETSSWFSWVPSLSSLNPFASKETSADKADAPTGAKAGATTGKNDPSKEPTTAAHKQPAKSAADLQRAKEIAAEAAQPFAPARLAADMDALAKAVQAEKSFHQDNKPPLDASDAEKARKLRGAVDAAREKVARTLNAPGGPNHTPETTANGAAAGPKGTSTDLGKNAKAGKPSKLTAQSDAKSVVKSDEKLSAAQRIKAQENAVAKAVSAEKSFDQALRARHAAKGDKEMKEPLSAADAPDQRKLREAIEAARRQLAQTVAGTDPKPLTKDGAPGVVSGLSGNAKALPTNAGNLTANLPDIADPKAPAAAKPPLAFRLSEWISDERAHQAWREKHLAKINEAPIVREKVQEKLRTTVISRYVLNEKTGLIEKVEVPAEPPAAAAK